VTYASHMGLSRRKARDSAPMGGDQLLFNGVPIRPISAVGNSIAFNVAAPFRVSLGVIPKGADVAGVFVAVRTVFNAGTTNVLTAGTIAVPTLLCEAGDVNEAAVGTTPVFHRGGGVLLADTEFFAWYTQTGGAATTGLANVTVIWAVP